VLFLVDTLVQAMLAAAFVTGDVSLLQWHNANAQLLTLILLVETAAAFAVWRTRQAALWAACLAVLLIVLVGVQQMLGHARLLLVHIPLGVTIFGSAAALAVWSFTLQSARSQEHHR
jgi:hypothetical protein